MQNSVFVLPVLALVVGGVAGYNFQSLEPTANNPNQTSALSSDTALPQIAQDFSNSGATAVDNGPFGIVASDEEQQLTEIISAETNEVGEPVYVAEKIASEQDVQQIITQIDEYVRTMGNIADVDQLAETEAQLIGQINSSPELIVPLIDTYAQLPVGENKDFLRSMLSASGDFLVEEHALEQLAYADPGEQEQWLELLSSTGVNTHETRQALFGAMQNLDSPESLATALYAVVPETVSFEERTQVIDQLYAYAGSADETVRSAGIEVMSRWADKGDSYFIEDALTDESHAVRRAAVFSAYTSGIQSELIKDELIQILNDDDQPYALRMDAFDALKGYSLQSDEHQSMHQFHKSVQALEENVGAAKG